MRFVKKTICLLMVMFMVAGIFGNIQTNAKETSLATPKITVKLIKKKTGVKITIGKTKNADSYEVSITGIPANSEYCEYFKHKASDGNVYMETGFNTVIEKNGKAKRSLTFKDLQPGTYTVKVRSWNNGTNTYSEWSKEKTFTLKESTTTGYSTSYDFSKVKKGDVIKFGSYEQDLNYTNGKEPIEWIVIEKTQKAVLLLSKYALDRLPYNKDWGSVTWETCTLRKWLNNAFIKSAFNKTERGMIKTTTVENFDNVIYRTEGGKNTKDKVFLLSQLEIRNSDYGFSKNYEDYDINRRCALAWYKNKKQADKDYQTADGEYTCWWWLRSPGDYAHFVCDVDYLGYVHSDGISVDLVTDTGINAYDDYSAGVRPAMWIKIKP
ncbi:MAG: fibronectin type III domain-containing protein [Lachnospiraceae bacterium]|nr:fibronectin type III domain-containing protein [Lachnospiraceae bacterium]